MGGALAAVGGAVAAAAAATGEAAVDAALAGGGSDVNLEAVKDKVERDPTLWRRDGETFQEWVRRLGIYSLIDDVHEARRFQLRADYTDSVLARAHLKRIADDNGIDLHALEQIHELYQRTPHAPRGPDPREERFMDRPPNTPLPLTGKRGEVMSSLPIYLGR